jgi:TetR/AcrR family transcriptional regulator, mexJK operon transcriptional repressor
MLCWSVSSGSSTRPSGLEGRGPAHAASAGKARCDPSIFLREGWSGANLERIAAEGGFSKMTVYRHFGTKEELFEALVEGIC